jgi:hypothetical protein
MIPQDVQAMIKKQNAELAQQIDDQRNEKFFAELKKLYTDRWNAYKDSF